MDFQINIAPLAEDSSVPIDLEEFRHHTQETASKHRYKFSSRRSSLNPSQASPSKGSNGDEDIFRSKMQLLITDQNVFQDFKRRLASKESQYHSREGIGLFLYDFLHKHVHFPKEESSTDEDANRKRQFPRLMRLSNYLSDRKASSKSTVVCEKDSMAFVSAKSLAGKPDLCEEDCGSTASEESCSSGSL